jgi:hypothetical protein
MLSLVCVNVNIPVLLFLRAHRFFVSNEQCHTLLFYTRSSLNEVGSRHGTPKWEQRAAAWSMPLSHAPCTLDDSMLLSCTASPANHTHPSGRASSSLSPVPTELSALARPIRSQRGSQGSLPGRFPGRQQEYTPRAYGSAAHLLRTTRTGAAGTCRPGSATACMRVMTKACNSESLICDTDTYTVTDNSNHGARNGQAILTEHSTL